MPKSKQARSSINAVNLLTEDHKKVKKLFSDFEKSKEEADTAEKAALVKEICNELSVHAKVEEEIFYPAIRESTDEEALMDEADVEHATAKSLIAELEAMKPGDDHYDAKVTVLGEYIDHHVKEEQGEIFKKARSAKVDLAELGERITRRKEELQANPKLLRK